MKNLVVCCDGTGNEISENISNVLKFYRALRKSDVSTQVVFYHPGLGTLARPNPWTKLWQDTKTLLGLATGYGLDDSVLASYEFLLRHYEDNDQIYIFGFSRGAHTARVIAALVHKVGLLHPEQLNLGGAALTAYKQSTARPSAAMDNERPATHIKPTKIQKCLDLLTTRDGATINELVAATGWRAHSARGFLACTVKKKLGLTLDSKKADDGTRHYCIVAAEA